MTPAWIGIDPGASGAVALVMPDSSARVWDIHPAGLQQVRDLLSIFCLQIAVEEQQAFRGRDGRVQGVASTFRLGREYGRILGYAQALGLDFHTVRPAVWKARMGLIGRGKAGSMALARDLFPGVVIRRHDQAEALLIAEYGRRYL